MSWHDVLFGFDGRIGRKTFWIAFVAVIAVELVCQTIARAIEGERLTSIVSLAFGYPEFAIMAKRGYDRGMPTVIPASVYGLSVVIGLLIVLDVTNNSDDFGSYMLLLNSSYLLFFLGLLIYLGFVPGTPGPNRYGPPPTNRG